MGTKLKAEGKYINFELNYGEIIGYKYESEYFNSKYAKSNENCKVLKITGNVSRIVTLNPDNYKKIKLWAGTKYKPEADYYIKITVTQIYMDEVFKEIIFSDAYVQSFIEDIDTATGSGIFVLTLFQKENKEEDIVFNPFDDEFKESNNFDNYLNESQVTLSKNMKGENVKQLQIKLNNLGYDCGNIDGIFGDKTETAVKNFQRDYNLVVDGIVGKNTYYELFQAQNNNRKTINENRVILTKLLEQNNIYPNYEGSKATAIVNNNTIVMENGNITVSNSDKEITYTGTIIMGRTVVNMNEILVDFNFGESFQVTHSPYHKFGNADEAALAFALTYGPDSINNNKEFSSVIFEYKFGYFEISHYGFAPITTGKQHNVKPQTSVKPEAGDKAKRYITYGTIHTHGAESGSNYTDEKFSPADINIINSKNSNFKCGYLVTPGGKLLKYIKNGKTSILTDKLTKDPNAKVFD